MEIATVDNVARNIGWTDSSSKVHSSDTMNRKKYDNILLQPCEKNSLKQILWIPVFVATIFMSGIVFSMPATTVPITNAIKYPSYWWEPMITGFFFVNSLFESAYTLGECKLIYGYDFLFSYKTLAWLLMINMLSISLPYVISCFIWSFLLGYNHPIPLLGLICYISWNISSFISMWFLFPYSLRKKQGPEIRSYIKYRLWFFFSSQQKNALNMILGLLPSGLQWIMAFLLPLQRELNLWVLVKILKKKLLSENYIAHSFILELTPTIIINLYHAFWVSIIITSRVSSTTEYLILAADFIINIYNTIKILRIHRKTSSNGPIECERIKMTKMKETFELFGIEMIEALTPIVFMTTFLIAYYGPNAEKIGGVKMNLWQHTPMEDLPSFSKDLISMFFVEFMASFISGVLLWKFSSINYLKEGYKVLKVFWPIMSIAMGGAALQVFKKRYTKKLYHISQKHY